MSNDVIVINKETIVTSGLPPGFRKVYTEPDALCEGTQFAKGSDGQVYASEATKTMRIKLTRYEKRREGSHILFDEKEGAAEGINCPALISGQLCGLYRAESPPPGVRVPPPRCYRFSEVSLISR